MVPQENFLCNFHSCELHLRARQESFSCFLPALVQRKTLGKSQNIDIFRSVYHFEGMKMPSLAFFKQWLNLVIAVENIAGKKTLRDFSGTFLAQNIAKIDFHSSLSETL